MQRLYRAGSVCTPAPNRFRQIWVHSAPADRLCALPLQGAVPGRFMTLTKRLCGTHYHNPGLSLGSMV